MIQAVVKIVVATEKRAEILKSMRSTVEPTRVQQGCVDCRVCIEAIDPNVLRLIQMWDNRGSLGRHVRSDIYPTLLAIMESSIEPPEIVFHTISKTEGLEAVEKLRERGAWRGDAKERKTRVPWSCNPEKSEKRINKVVKKLFKKFPASVDWPEPSKEDKEFKE